MAQPPCKGCPDRQAGCHNTAVCSKWAEYQVAKAVEQSNLPSQQEKEDMRGYITAHRTRGWAISAGGEGIRMMNKAYLKADYEATKNLVDLTIRQRELLEAWLYAGQTMGQLALRYGINRSTVSRTINRAAEKIAKTAYWIHRQRTRTFSKSDYQN